MKAVVLSTQAVAVTPIFRVPNARGQKRSTATKQVEQFKLVAHTLAQSAPSGLVEKRPAKELPSSPGLWKNFIEEDAQGLWQTLQRLVASHPLVRPILGNGHLVASASPTFSLHDLTQDLYVLLLEKGRFAYYLERGMADAEIEREIYQIELTNLMIGRLRKYRPENYRMARRVSAILESDTRFKVFRQRASGPSRYRQASEAIYGRECWDDGKRMRDSGTFEAEISHIPMRRRDLRKVGCSGDSQVIISSPELAELIDEILQATDSPMALRVLRTLVLSKLPVYDAVITSIDEDTEHENGSRNSLEMFVANDATPEQAVLDNESQRQARALAHEFLARLQVLAKGNEQRGERLWRVLWHCFFDAAEPSQLSIAELVGISDSSVSDYRRKIEAEVRRLPLTAYQLGIFAEELDRTLRARLARSQAVLASAAIGLGKNVKMPAVLWRANRAGELMTAAA